MASLTGQLQTETRGKSMLPGQAAAPSFVNSLLSVATGAIQGYGPMQKRMEAQKTKDALNDAEQAQFDFLNQKEQELNPAFKAAGDELALAQTAEKQGRAPAGSSELRAEKVVSDLYSRFPADKAAIAQYLQGRGFDHYLFQSVKQEEKWKASMQESERAASQASMKAAVDAGVWDPNDLNKSIKSGQEILAANRELEIAQKKAELAIKISSEKREQSKFELEQASKQGVDAAIKIAGEYTNYLIPNVASLVSTAGDEKGRQEFIAKLAPDIKASLEAFRAKTKARMPWMTKDAMDAFDAHIDDSIKNVDTLLNAQFETNKKVLDNMKTQFGIEDAQAVPTYSRISRLFGQETANAIFGADPAAVLPPDVVDKMRKEAMGLKTQDDTQASITIANILAIKAGTKGIGDMPEAEARRIMPTLVKMSLANQASIAAGGVTPANANDFYQSQSQVVNAASELQAGLSDAKSISVAIEAVANPNMGKAFGELKKSEQLGAQFEPFVVGNRAVTAQLLRVAQQSGPDSTEDGVFNIRFIDGVYQVTTNETLKAKRLREAGAVAFAADYPGSENAATITKPAWIQEKANMMNKALNHLIATRNYDDGTPKGATNLELRRFYALGEVPKSAQGEGGGSANDQWMAAAKSLQAKVERVATTGGADIVTDEAISNAKTASEAAPVTATPTASFKGASISPGDAVSRFQSHGVPDHVAQGIVGNLMAESGLRTGAVGDGGKALSLAQWHPDRREHAAKAGFDLSNPQDAIDFVMWELNNTEAPAKKKLAAARTVREAADIFALYFLRPQGAQTGNAENVHNIEGRRKYAQGLAQR